MREYPESNYYIGVVDLVRAKSYEMYSLLPGSYYIKVNGIISVSIVTQLGRNPWPPPWPPLSFDHWDTAEAAAQCLFVTTNITVAPHEIDHVVKEVVQYDDLIHTAFWLPRARFELLRNDVELVYRSRKAEPARLTDLAGRPLERLLKDELPQAALNEYEKKILCLP